MELLEQYTPVVVTDINEEVPGVKTFYLRSRDGAPLPYMPGQFLTFIFTHHGREDRRSFSISSGGYDEALAVTVKRLDNGAYSRYLTDRVKVGDVLYTTGAAGLFTLPADIGNYRQIFFFAAGIGITPILSLLKHTLQAYPDMQTVLVYSNRSQEEVAFYNQLHTLAATYSGRLQLELLYSNAFNLNRARLNKALVPQLIRQYARVGKNEMLFYICGPFDYMRMVIYALEEQHILPEQIKREHFNTNNRAVKLAEPPDRGIHTVTIHHAGSADSVTVAYPQTILQAARSQGINLPYSCETGRCGSCAVRCTSGRVWMSYNEVLMEKELHEGLVLTCTAHPVDGDVALSL